MVVLEGVPRPGGVDVFVREDAEVQLELLGQLILPLLHQDAGADDHAPLQVATGNEFLDEEPGHDGLARPRVIGQQEPQGLAGEHVGIDSGDLVGEGPDQAGVDGQHGVEQVRQPDAISLIGQPEGLAVSIEAPCPATVHHIQGVLLVPVENIGVGHSAGVLVGDLNRP